MHFSISGDGKEQLGLSTLMMIFDYYKDCLTGLTHNIETGY